MAGAAATGIYHERQTRQFCGLHALNNLFQDGTTFDKASLDAICHRLAPGAWINPHKSMLGLGNYDVNVLMAALDSKGYAAEWFDRRRNVSVLQLDNIFGFVLNVPNHIKLGGVLPLPTLGRKHWIAVKFINGTYYNLDSNLSMPVPIGLADDLLQYLESHLASPDNQLLVAVTSQVAVDITWRK